MNPPNTPTFETWTHENLAKFATEAYLKIREQHELIQYLRMLINDHATVGETHNAGKTD